MNIKGITSILKIKKVNTTYNLLWLMIVCIAIYCTSCANMQTPTGGPKDSIPPVLLNELPTNLSRNFKEKVIDLEFDEYIKLNNNMSL